MSYIYKWPRPMVTSDIIVLKKVGTGRQILLIKRLNDPFKDSWALPGGYVDVDEDVIDCAYRELKEETGIENIKLQQFRAYGKKGRDPRGHTITVVCYGEADGTEKAIAGDDAKALQWFDVECLPSLAFDHDAIIGDFLAN